MATVRIFVPTYRRPHLLPRALASLRDQTFSDWVCELHNDDPADARPAQLAAELGDSRITVVTHPCNLGGTATFNLFFRTTTEPFYAMLEDDNWWEPEFLEVMITTAQMHPASTVFWANQRLWDELPDGSWRDTGRCVWPETSGTDSVCWGNSAQAAGALHAHGAALFRSRPGDDFSTPDIPIAVTEPFRERALPHPLIRVNQPIAHFAQTLQTARSQDAAEWAELQAMLLATYFRDCPWPESRIEAFWTEARGQKPPTSPNLILAALADPGGNIHLAHASWRDWLVVLRGFLRRPGLWPRLRRSRRVHSTWWEYLERHTRIRWQEYQP